jgi:two-component system response regulator EvgA
VLVVDDHASFRRVARLLQFEGYEVVGEAEDGLSGLAAARALAPDLVLLDIQPPDIDGFDVAARLTSGERAPAVILTSSQDGDVGLVRLPDPPAARVPRGPPPGAAREGARAGHFKGLLGFDYTGGIAAWLPLFLFVVLFGLSMDYHAPLVAAADLARAGGRGRPGLAWPRGGPPGAGRFSARSVSPATCWGIA